VLAAGNGDDSGPALSRTPATSTRCAGAARARRAAAARTAPGEIVAGEIRVALQALGEVTGEAVAPDLLARIFARFCIGK
jgi:tRNA modification GTPase